MLACSDATPISEGKVDFMSRVLHAVSSSGGDSAESHIGGLRANYLAIFAFNGDIYSADSFLAREKEWVPTHGLTVDFMKVSG